MKITASRVDDILRQREEYDQRIAKMTEREKETEDAYHAANYASRREIEKRVSDLIGPTSLVIEVRASLDYIYERGIDDAKWAWSISVRANDRNKFDKNVALAWNWDVKLGKEGTIIKDSGSWSGLKAITPEQIADLEESVRVIKLLNNIDWKPVLSSDIVRFEDYIDKENAENLRQLKQARPRFEDDLVAAQLEELVGGNTAIKLTSDEYFRGPVWILPTGLTDKFVRGFVFPDFYLSRGDFNNETIRDMAEERRVGRNKIALDGGELITVDIPFKEV